MILACRSRCGHCEVWPGVAAASALLAHFYRCRTLLAFGQSEKRDEPGSTVEIGGNQSFTNLLSRARTKFLRKPSSQAQMLFKNIFLDLTLVVMMTPVNLWKALQLFFNATHSGDHSLRRLVKFSENKTQ